MWLRARGLEVRWKSSEGLEEHWVGAQRGVAIGTDAVVESLGWRGGFYLKMIAYLLGVDRWVVVVVEKERREAREGQCRRSEGFLGGGGVLTFWGKGWISVLNYPDLCWFQGTTVWVKVPSGFCSSKVKENNYRGHGDSVDQLCWHPSNPDLFVTASGDKTIRIWDVRTTKCIATVNTKGNLRERGFRKKS